MTAVWDNKLWDTFNPQLYSFTKYNQDFLKQYIDFLDKRGKIEEKYARDLRKLCKDFKPKEFDKKEKFKFSLQSSFDDMLSELVSLANQHDTLRDEMLKSAKDVKESLKELQKQFKHTENTIASLGKDLDKNRNQLNAVRQTYQRAYADMRKARDDYNANKDNKDITKNEEDRFQQVFMQKTQHFEERKNSYAKELSDFNAAQRAYYTQGLPDQLSSLQDQEARLAAACQRQFQAWGDSELQALDIQTKCAQTLRAKADLVNADADVHEFLRVTASGNPVPADLPFENLGSNDSLGQGGAKSTAGIGGGRPSKFNTLNKSGRAFGPAQQKRRLEEQLREKDLELEKAAKAVDALQKLMLTYQQNPKIGDVSAVQQQVQQDSEQLDKLQKERADIVKELENLGVEVSSMGGAAVSAVNAVSATPVQQQQQQQQQQQPHHPTGGDFADEFDDSPAITSPPRPPVPAVVAAAAPQEPSLPVCAMLYDFNDPSQPDNLAVVAGERLQILERDPDWTRVRRLQGNTTEQGFVPTAYMTEA